jgi:hypothetical protein
MFTVEESDYDTASKEMRRTLNRAAGIKENETDPTIEKALSLMERVN